MGKVSLPCFCVDDDVACELEAQVISKNHGKNITKCNHSDASNGHLGIENVIMIGNPKARCLCIRAIHKYLTHSKFYLSDIPSLFEITAMSMSRPL